MEAKRGARGNGRPARGRPLPALLILTAVAIDLLTPAPVSTVPLLAASPVAAAPLLSFRGTVLTGGVATLVGLALARWHGGIIDTAAVVELVSVVVVTVFAAAINRLMARDRLRLRSARDVAEAVQRAVLPPAPSRLGPLRVATRYTAAEEEAEIGGDLYAIQETPHGVRLMVADVRGKGVGAVEVVTVVLGAFREAADHCEDLPGVARVLEQALGRFERVRDTAEGGERFVTAVIAEISPDHGRLRVANRGHPPPLLVHGGRVRVLEPTRPAVPLGLAPLAGDGDVPVDDFELPPGSALVLYTDGVTEARCPDGSFYDPLPRLSRPVPLEPGALLDVIIADLAAHTGTHLSDDAAMLAVTRP
ncbi:PP2C family protein-serine/threonine phosphatase [Peterkaempfera sp. SMS 1(5)a]|uniref:PP2C family protein-serine/threonine phosphatase n=1 Tax=Peterkaempfera podocarpi TaxID=3232308 RepID=UPI0036707065